MTVSAYQIDNVIKAYSRQNKVRLRTEEHIPGAPRSAPSDTVTLNGNIANDDVYRKISYTLLDLLKK
ncbi:MAG: hypothetical protein PHN75_06615 [Syntrophales bacterium]|nr:hypothetical protein [Syntrophales bacterium]